MASGLESNAASVAQELHTSSSSLSAAAMSAVSQQMMAPVADQEPPTGWLGFVGWGIYLVLNLTSLVIYWILRIATINIPTFLFTLFSTSWTITMNATTLWVALFLCPHVGASADRPAQNVHHGCRRLGRQLGCPVQDPQHVL